MEIIIILVVVVIVAVAFMYNKLVSLRTKVKEAWSSIDVQLKRRYNLIPNIMESVKGYAAHESDVFTRVTEARSQAINAGNVHEQGAAENMLEGALKSLFAVAENYPQLKANENFLQLQNELVDTEDKIQAARRFYNSIVRDYNTTVQQIPYNLFAGAAGFKVEEFFEIEKAEQRENVEVSFKKEEVAPAEEPVAEPLEEPVETQVKPEETPAPENTPEPAPEMPTEENVEEVKEDVETPDSSGVTPETPAEPTPVETQDLASHEEEGEAEETTDAPAEPSEEPQPEEASVEPEVPVEEKIKEEVPTEENVEEIKEDVETPDSSGVTPETPAEPETGVKPGEEQKPE